MKGCRPVFSHKLSTQVRGFLWSADCTDLITIGGTMNNNSPTYSHSRFPLRWLGGVLLALLAATPGFAQLDRGTINGQITDQTGAIVPGAKVQVIGIETN